MEAVRTRLGWANPPTRPVPGESAYAAPVAPSDGVEGGADVRYGLTSPS
jgi:hypothetical protein